MEKTSRGPIKWVYRPLWHLIRAWLSCLGYRHDDFHLPEGGTLIAANHTASIDPLFCLVCFPERTSIVLSEHLQRKKAFSRLMDSLLTTITRVKTRTESQTAFQMIRRLKNGENVLIFPEGNMSYSGTSGKNMPGLGRLVKISGCNLVTIRLEDTYAVMPRWGKGIRTGACYGRKVHLLTGEDLKAYSAEEIEDLLRDDLSFDFYEKEAKGRYRSGKRAEHLESFLYRCPNCGGVSTLKSRGKRFWCDCGLDLTLDERLRFVSNTKKEAPFATIRDWYLWQNAQALPEAAQDAALTADEGVTFNRYTVTPPETFPQGEGTLVLYRDRLEIPELKFSVPLEKITDVTTVQRRIFCFSVEHETYYEVIGTDTFSPVKYAQLVADLNGARNMI